MRNLAIKRLAQAITLLASLSAMAACAVVLFQMPIAGDAKIYFALGRAGLNGLHLWRDVFDARPPIISWISQASLALTQGPLLYQLLLFGGLIGLLAILSRVRVIPGVLLGVTISLYVLFRGMGYQTESFAVLPSAIALYALWRDKSWWPALVALAIMFLGLLKEPFIFSFLAALMLLASPSAWRRIIIACILGGSGAILVLALTGLLQDYFTLYLPEMLSGRVIATLGYHDYRNDSFLYIDTPLWIKAMWTWKWIEEFSPTHLILPGISFFTLLASYGARSWRQLLLTSAFLMSLFTNLNQFYLIRQAYAFIGPASLGSAFFRWKIFELVALALVSVALGLLLHRKAILRQTLIAFAAAYCVTAAAALGNFQYTHFLYAIPVLVALSLRFLGQNSPQMVMLAVLLLLNLPFMTYRTIEKLNEQQNPTRLGATLVDNVLTTCKVSRYLAPDQYGLDDVVGYTTHTPIQLHWGLMRIEDRPLLGKIQLKNDYLAEKMRADWERLNVIVTHVGADHLFPFATYRTSFETEFTTIPPKCAEAHLAGDRHDVRFFFRKNWVAEE